MIPELDVLEKSITNGLAAINDSIYILIAIFVLIGYLSKYWYDIGYYHSLYKPITKASNLEYWLSHALYGITSVWVISFLLLVAWTLYAMLAGYNSNELAPILACLLFLMAIILPAASSIVIGWWCNSGLISQKKQIRIILFSGESIPAISVYADDGTFLYYVNLDKTWSSIRKNDVASIRQIR